MGQLKSAFLIGLATLGVVEGGHRAWEPPIHSMSSKAVLLTRDVVEIMTGNGTMRNASVPMHSHQKRAVTIIPNPHGSGAFPQLWPGGTITACFEQRQHQKSISGGGSITVSTRTILEDDLLDAYRLWTNAGINFQFNILADNNPRCNPNHPNYRQTRPSVLLISYAGDNVQMMRTDVGMVSADNSEDSNARQWGPSMLLSDVADMGMGNVVPNYAHELGHAWGLHHEHQNPRWWSEEYSDLRRSSVFFDANSFHCDNLRDYQDARTRVQTAEPHLGPAQIDIMMNKACLDGDTARGPPYRFFGAANLLPIKAGNLVNSVFDDGRSEPDWNSIMIYPSDCGGVLVGGVKQNVLTRRNGDLIPKNLRPSARDVEGLKKLYGVNTAFRKSLLNDPGNALKGAFDKIRKQDPDVPCL